MYVMYVMYVCNVCMYACMHACMHVLERAHNVCKRTNALYRAHLFRLLLTRFTCLRILLVVIVLLQLLVLLTPVFLLQLANAMLAGPVNESW